MWRAIARRAGCRGQLVDSFSFEGDTGEGGGAGATELRRASGLRGFAAGGTEPERGRAASFRAWSSSTTTHSGTIEKRTLFFPLSIPLTGRILAVLSGRDGANTELWHAEHETRCPAGVSKGMGSCSPVCSSAS